MKIKDIFRRDPLGISLVNEGVANVAAVEDRTLKYELETFVCEGEYAKGMSLILDGYLGSVDKPEQPAVWVSGFSGRKVPLVRYSGTSGRTSPSTTSPARGLVRLPPKSVTRSRAFPSRKAGVQGSTRQWNSRLGLSVPLAVAVVFRSLDLRGLSRPTRPGCVEA